MNEYFSADVGKGGFEAATRGELVTKIAEYYAENAEPDEDNGRYYAPEATSVTRHVSGMQGDEEIEFLPTELASFNSDVDEEFQASVGDTTTDYEEHNTHWKGCAL